MSEPIEDKVLDEIAKFEMNTGCKLRFIIAGGKYFRSIQRACREAIGGDVGAGDIKYYGCQVVRVEPEVLMTGE